MPDMDEGAFILDYEMPVGTSLGQTDKILRRVEAVLQDTPDIAGYIRRTGAENGLFVTESFRGDVLVSLKPPGQRRPMQTIFDSPPEDIKKAVPELESLELLPLIKDQLNDLAGLQRPIGKSKSLVPMWLYCELSGTGSRRGRSFEIGRSERPRAFGKSRFGGSSENSAIVRLGLWVKDLENQLNAAMFGQIVGTIPERDRLTNIRVRFPDRFRFDVMNWDTYRLACLRQTQQPERQMAQLILQFPVRVFHRSLSRSVNWQPSSWCEVRTNFGTKPTAGDHSHSQTRGSRFGHDQSPVAIALVRFKVSPGYHLGTSRWIPR